MIDMPVFSVVGIIVDLMNQNYRIRTNASAFGFVKRGMMSGNQL